MRANMRKFAKSGAAVLAAAALATSLGACSGTASSGSATSTSTSGEVAASTAASGDTWATKSAEELSTETVADGDWLRAIDWTTVEESDEPVSLMGIAKGQVTAKKLRKLVASTSVHVADKSTASESPSIKELLKSKTKFSNSPDNAIKLYMNPVEKDAYGQTTSTMFDVFTTYASGKKTFAQMVSSGSYYLVSEYGRPATAFGVGNAGVTDLESMNAMVQTYGKPAYIADIEGQQGNCHCILWERDGYLFGCMYNEVAVSSDNLRVDRVVYIPEESWETVKQDLADNAQYTWYDFDEYVQNL